MLKNNRKNDFWKSVARKYGFFMFWSLMLKQLTYLTTIYTFCCLGGQGVIHMIAVSEVFGSIPCSDKDFNVCFLYARL